MARTRQLQRASIPKSFTSRGSTPRPRSAVILLVVAALTAVWAVAMLSPFGNLIHAFMFVFTAFYAGPVTLVSLSLTVMVGLVATDRIVLLIRHRVLLQSAHRALGIVAVFGLALHVLTKISAGHVTATTAVLPFLDGADVYVGLGTLAAVLMLFVLWTGLVRARFAGVGKPWLWRALHSVAYASWPVALVHGLMAGRPAATWVTLSYVLCVVVVVVLLLVRLSVSLGRKRQEQAQTTGSMAPVGRPAARTGPSAPARRRTAEEIRSGRRSGGGRDDRWSSPSDRVHPGGRRRRSSLDDLRGDDTELTIDGWARAGAFDTMDSPRRDAGRRADPADARDAVGGRATEDGPELPWDSPRRWSSARSQDQTGQPDRDDAQAGDDRVERRSWRDRDDAATVGRRRRDLDDEEEPAGGGVGRHGRRRGADDAEDSGPEWGRAARYEPNLVARRGADDDDDDDTPTLVDLAARRARRAGGRNARRRRTDEEGYWAGVRGEVR